MHRELFLQSLHKDEPRYCIGTEALSVLIPSLGRLFRHHNSAFTARDGFRSILAEIAQDSLEMNAHKGPVTTDLSAFWHWVWMRSCHCTTLQNCSYGFRHPIITPECRLLTISRAASRFVCLHQRKRSQLSDSQRRQPKYTPVCTATTDRRTVTCLKRRSAA